MQQALDLPDDRVRRVAFHEITERAVKDAFSKSGPINMEMVNAQQARRFLDRFVGYQLSPLLWKKVGARNLSAGRVQSVAVRLIADRERDIRAFVTEEYWKIAATVSPAGSTAATDQFKASLAEYDGAKFEAKTEAEAHAIRDALQSVPYSVAKIDETEKLDRADAPFKTSTLQQQAAIRLRFSGKRTMKVAQELYEGIDVDGTGPGRLDHLHAYRQPPGLGRSDDRRPREDQDRVRRSLLARQADPLRRRQECPGGPRGRSAHRPRPHARTRSRARSPTTSSGFTSSSTRGSSPARWPPPSSWSPTSRSRPAPGIFKAQGKVQKFDGHRRVWPPGGKQEDELLPILDRRAARSTCTALDATQHFTQPPPRYSEATLIKALEKEAIGRPSTYAPIIQTIQDRGYVEQKERRFHATHLGMAVTDLLVEQFPKILDLKFTAQMEDKLDDIATAKEEMTKVLDEFYYPFQEELKAAETHMERVQIPTNEICHLCDAPMVLKFGKTGQFLGCSKYPECKATRPLGGQPRAEAVESEHSCPKCGKKLFIRENKREREVSLLLGLSRVQGVVQHRPRGQSRPVGRRDRIQVREMRQADGVAPGLARRRSWAARATPSAAICCRSTTRGNLFSPSRSRSPAPSAAARWPCSAAAGVHFLGCTNYPKCRGTAQVPDDLKDKLAEQAAPRRRRPPT